MFEIKIIITTVKVSLWLIDLYTIVYNKKKKQKNVFLLIVDFVKIISSIINVLQ